MITGILFLAHALPTALYALGFPIVEAISE